MLHAISFILMLLHSTSFRLHSDFLRNYHAKHQRLYLEVVKVELGDRSYPIYIGNELLKTGEVFMDHVRNKKILIVTNTVVAPLYLSAVKDSLKSNGIEVFEVILPDGEEFKTINVLMKIIDVAIDSKLDRQSVFIALGGGVIGDMCGFAASIYQRGVKFIQIPTTLMAMVDSAVGGKTAVNHEKAKNMIGTFYQPEAVVIDIDTLLTLPDRELKSGISEIIKYGLIRDRGFFEWLECNMDQILKRNALALTHAIKASCINKAEVVRLDEKESSSGVRATLNLGHTFGHAIENGLGYGTWLHGEAVAAGIVLASDMSLQSGLIDSQLFSRIKELIVKAGLPIDLKDEKNFFASNDKDCVENKKKYDEKVDNLTSEKFLELMSIDKKVAHGKLNLVLLQGEEVGRAIVTDDFDESILKKIVFEYCHKPSTTI